MPPTRITGLQVKDTSITEDDLSLSDRNDWNVSINRHGFCPKLPNNPNMFLNGQGVWAHPQQLVLPNLYYIHPSFNNTSPYFEDINTLMSFLNQYPPQSTVAIIVYPGTYAAKQFVYYPSRIYNYGGIFSDYIEIQADCEIYGGDVNRIIINQSSGGNFVAYCNVVSDVAVQSESKVTLYVHKIENNDINLGLRVHYGVVNVYANSISNIICTGGVLRVNSERILRCDAKENSWLYLQCKLLIDLTISNLASVSVYDALISVNSANSAITINGSHCTKLVNCVVNQLYTGYPAIYIPGNINYLWLVNSNLDTASLQTPSIDCASTQDLYVRGQSVARTAPNNVIYRTPTTLTIDNSYHYEVI